MRTPCSLIPHKRNSLTMPIRRANWKMPVEPNFQFVLSMVRVKDPFMGSRRKMTRAMGSGLGSCSEKSHQRNHVNNYI